MNITDHPDSQDRCSLIAGKVLTSEHLQIDGLRILGNIKKRKMVDERYYDEMGNVKRVPQDYTFVEFQKNIGLTDVAPAKYPYTWQFKHVLGFYVFISQDRNIRDVCIDVNPRDFQTPELKQAYHDAIDSILDNLTDVSVSRLDLNIDFQRDLSDCKMDTESPKKSRVFRSANKALETCYLGTRQSRTMYRIYNKALERGENDATAEHPVNWWRVEVQYNFDKDFTILDINPFSDLFISKLEFPSDITWQEELIFHALSQNPSLWQKIPRSTKTRYRSKYKKHLTLNIRDEILAIVQRDMPRILTELRSMIEVERTKQ